MPFRDPEAKARWMRANRWRWKKSAPRSSRSAVSGQRSAVRPYHTPVLTTKNQQFTRVSPSSSTLLNSSSFKSERPAKESQRPVFETSIPAPRRELPGTASPLRENRPSVTAPQLPAGCSSQGTAPVPPPSARPTRLDLFLSVLGPLAGITPSVPVQVAPAPRPADPPAHPAPQSTAPRVRPAQHGRQAKGFAPEEGFAIQGGN